MTPQDPITSSSKYNKRSALVTGGTRGIGLAIADSLAKENIAVTITGRSPEWKNRENFQYLSVDFTDSQQVDHFISQIQNLSFDILINNAGVNSIGPFHEITKESFDFVQQVNLRSPFLVTQAIIPGMKQRGFGRIVNISSIFGVVSKAMRAPYSASKFGLDGMTAALAAEVAPYGILANCVSPGFVDTELTSRVLGEDGIREVLQNVPIGRLAQPHEIAELVKWLASEQNTYVSGQNIVIDGGFTRV